MRGANKYPLIITYFLLVFPSTGVCLCSLAIVFNVLDGV